MPGHGFPLASASGDDARVVIAGFDLAHALGFFWEGCPDHLAGRLRLNRDLIKRNKKRRAFARRRRLYSMDTRVRPGSDTLSASC
jgi:hypothetical protein